MITWQSLKLTTLLGNVRCLGLALELPRVNGLSERLVVFDSFFSVLVHNRVFDGDERYVCVPQVGEKFRPFV